MLAATEPSVVQKEPQPIQVRTTQMSAQEEVPTQPTVQVLDHRTGTDDGVDVAQGEVVVEEVVEEFDDTAQRTVPDEDQSECELADPVFGDGQVEQDRIVGGWWVEGVVECVSCEVLLLVDELAADVRVLRESGDGLCAGQSVEREALSLFGSECLGR